MHTIIHNKKIILLIVLLAGSVFVNIYLLKYRYISKSSIGAQNTPIPNHAYPYLSLRIFNQNKNDVFINFMPLRQLVSSYIETKKHPIHIYFEYIPSGVAIGIHDEDEMPMASLIKVPTVMGIYKKIEQGSLTADQLLTLTQDDIDTHFGTLWKNGPGYQLTVKEAIQKALIDSDNTAHLALYHLLNQKDINDVYSKLDIRMDQKDTEILPYISAQSYASVLKSLYLSTFLSPDSSNEILSILTKNNDTAKMVANLPKDIAVAHKSGVYEKIDGHYFYSDCGLVYIPRRPYVFCAMSEASQTAATEDIKEISEIIYKFVASTETKFDKHMRMCHSKNKE